jgi:hypothetical protein
VSILSSVLDRYNGIVARGRDSGPTMREVRADLLEEERTRRVTRGEP